jgi:dihydrofolate synthase/folylpolyglutamate synthase
MPYDARLVVYRFRRSDVSVKTLAEWCAYIATVHALPMELGLTRVREVARRLKVLTPSASVITVGGTNGKGSCVAGLEAVYRAAGFRTGAFTSPYLLRLNEEIRVAGVAVDDDAFCTAFGRIEAARGDIVLTVFEFNTLAALLIFQEAQVDVLLLEVGLGGRLDAVNIIDADVAVVTSIAIDHALWLGDTRELIGCEKAGIFRSGKPVVCGDFSPPQTLLQAARALDAPLYCQSQDFHFAPHQNSWVWQSQKNAFADLPLTSLALQNMATVLMTVELLQQRLAVSRQAIDTGLQQVKLTARIQVLTGDITQIFDVAHNPAAAQWLADKLKILFCGGKTRAVFSMLADKDIGATLQVIKNYIDEWHIAALPVARGASLEILQHAFQQEKITSLKSYADVAQAYQAAFSTSKTGDRVVVFGSFYTVAAVIKDGTLTAPALV